MEAGVGLAELGPDLRETDVFQVLAARRVAQNAADRLMHLVPYPEGVDVKNPLPEWTRLPLSAKIPFVRAPKDYTVYKRGKLGESVRRQGETFDLSDPHSYGLQMKYEPIHDKHLKHYFYSPGNKKILDDMGILTKENQVKCKLNEYNAYRGYVYNVHKNSVLKALREQEGIVADKAEARKFMEAARRLRENQAGAEKVTKQAVRRAAQRRVVEVCRRLVCESRQNRLEKVKEKQQKQKEHAHLKLLVSQKDFQEQLKDYKIKSQEVNWRRNIRAQNKWKKVLEKEEYRKYVTQEVDRINKLYEVIENWIKKEIHQLKTRARDNKIYNSYKTFSNKRKLAAEKRFKRVNLRNARRRAEIKKFGPTPKRILDNQKFYATVGDIYTGIKKLPPNMNVPEFEKPLLQAIMTQNANNDSKVLAKKYWGRNIMKSRYTTEMADSIMQCVYIRAVKLYLKHAIFRYFPIVITELKHVIMLFEEDETRKKCTVDEIRRFARSYVGQRKGDIFHCAEPFTAYGYLGCLKRKLYRSRGKGFCRCDSESERESGKVQLSREVASAVVDKEKRVSFMAEAPEAAQAPKRTKGAPAKSGSKPSQSKGKKKQQGTILKQCPLKPKGDEGQADVICCDPALRDVCTCNREVKKVTISQQNDKNPLEQSSSGAEVENVGVKVTFDPNPKIIPIPFDAYMDLESSDLWYPEVCEEKNTKRPQTQKRGKCASWKANNAESAMDSLQESIESNDALSKQQIPNGVSEEISSVKQSISKLNNIQNAFKPDVRPRYSFNKRDANKTDTELSSSSDYSYKFCKDIGNAIEIMNKITEEKKNPSVCSGRINVSSSSIDSISGNDEDSIPVTTLDESLTRTDGRFKKKNMPPINKGNISHRSYNRLAHDGGGNLNRLNDCRKFNELQSNNLCGSGRVASNEAKKKLEAKFAKYIAKQCSGEPCENNEFQEEGKLYRNTSNNVSNTLDNQKSNNPENLVIKNGSEAVNVNKTNGEVKEISTPGSPTTKAKETDVVLAQEGTAPRKRGTELRDLLKENPTSSAKRGYGEQKGTKFYLQQVFEPSYRPNYSPGVTEDAAGMKKSILVKTEYSPAENCSLVDKFIKQYRLKGIEDLRKFVKHQMTIRESEALAAVKTEHICRDPSEIKSKECKSSTDDKIDLNVLKKYSKDVVPARGDHYKKLVRTSKLVISVDQKSKDDEKEEFDEELQTEASNGPFLVETGPEKTVSYTRLVMEAVPEINEVFTQFFNREIMDADVTETRKECTSAKSERKGKPTDAGGRLVSKAFNSPEDIIEDSNRYRENCLKGEIVFTCDTLGKTPARSKRAGTRKRGTDNLEPKQRDASSSSSDGGRSRVPVSRRFTFLEPRLFGADELKLCEVCQNCTLKSHGGQEEIVEKNVLNLLECPGCGACVHDMTDDGTSTDSGRPLEEASPAPRPESESSTDASQPQVAFYKDKDLKQLTFKKSARVLASYADLRAVFGHDFDPDKFVYFVKKDKDFICFKDILKKRYPVQPFPWDVTKVERLKKKKLPLKEIKSYRHCKDIFRNKVADGYGIWETTKNAVSEKGKTGFKWNKVPKKYEKLFSTTLAPANRPARTLKPIKERRPTPVPSVTDMVTAIVEESGGDMHLARRMTKEHRLEAEVVRSKVDTAVRALMDAVTEIAILKLKEGYPRMKSLAEGKANYYYLPTGYHKHYAEKVARGLSEVLYGLETQQINFARLQPLVDIILRNVLDYKKCPLVFPESAADILYELTDSEPEPT